MTAAVTLSGTGYGRLFVGTGEQAAAAAESEHIPFTENAEGKYVYTFELPALDEEISVAAWSTKNSSWYDRKLTFKSNKLPESAHNAANGGLIPNQPNRPGDLDNIIQSDDHQDGNPNTGILGMTGISVAAAAAAVVFSRKKR